MSKLSKNKIFIILVFLLLTSCQNIDKQSQKKSISELLNNKGFCFLQEYSLDNDKDFLLDSALYYFNEAIKADEHNLVAYHNRNAVLSTQKKYDEMIALLQEQLERVDSNDYGSLAVLNGELSKMYYFLGDSILGENMILKALSYFELVFKNNLNIDLIIEYLDLVAFSKGKDKALIELENFKNVLQKHNKYEDTKEFYINYNYNP